MGPLVHNDLETVVHNGWGDEKGVTGRGGKRGAGRGLESGLERGQREVLREVWKSGLERGREVWRVVSRRVWRVVSRAVWRVVSRARHGQRVRAFATSFEDDLMGGLESEGCRAKEASISDARACFPEPRQLSWESVRLKI